SNDVNPPMYQPFNPGFVGYDKSLDKPTYNVKKAKALVQEAGAQGKTLQLLQLSTAVPYDNTALVVQQELQAIGFTVNVVPSTGTNNKPMWMTGNYDLAVTSLPGRIDPASTLGATYLAQLNLGSVPADLQDMANKALALPFGSKERDKAYQDISRYMV